MTGNFIGRRVNADQAMKIAIAQAKKGLPTVGSNPAVGCVILDSEFRVVSTGYHRVSGEAHAEVDALNNLPENFDLTGCHVYITLEPCAFEGRTGACAQKLAQLPIASVTVGILDPHPQVNGQGIAVLRAAGIEVHLYENFQSDLKRLIEIYAHGLKNKEAFVAMKMATSLDAVIALESGESQWITSSEARDHGHVVRSFYDALLIGLNTFLLDNPRLNIRFGPHQDKVQKIIILDSELRGAKNLLKSKLMKTHAPENIILATSAKSSDGSRAFLPPGIQSLQVDLNSEGELDLNQLKWKLFEMGIRSVLVEGGAATYSYFLQQRAANRIYQYIAPIYIGAGGGISATSELKIKYLADHIKLKDVLIKRIKPDLLLTGTVIYP